MIHNIQKFDQIKTFVFGSSVARITMANFTESQIPLVFNKSHAPENDRKGVSSWVPGSHCWVNPP
jgi:hypothetical protein